MQSFLLNLQRFCDPIDFKVYENSGFLGLQLAIEMAYIDLVNGKPHGFQVETQAFPYPPYKNLEKSHFTMILAMLLPASIIIGFSYLVTNAITEIAKEKETGVTVSLSQFSEKLNERLKLPLTFSTEIHEYAWTVPLRLLVQLDDQLLCPGNHFGDSDRRVAYHERDWRRPCFGIFRTMGCAMVSIMLRFCCRVVLLLHCHIFQDK